MTSFRHFRLHAGEVGAGSCKRLLDLINENDDARRIDACEHGAKETLDVLDSANVLNESRKFQIPCITPGSFQKR
jgi:hypothetical protein